MHARSLLTQGQREAAVAWFKQGLADTAVATHLGVSRWPVRRLGKRWQIHAKGALVAKATKTSYSFEVKHDLERAQIGTELRT